LEDAIGAIAVDQENAGLDIISDGRVHGDNYADNAVYHYFRCMGYNLRGGHLGFPIYSRLHSGTVEQEIKRRGAMMVEQARALKRATSKPTKVQYTGVQVLAQCTNDLYYKSSRDRALAIAKAMNEDILEVDAMGIDFIQLDEFTWPYFYEDWAIAACSCCRDTLLSTSALPWLRKPSTPAGGCGTQSPRSNSPGGVDDL